MLSSFLFQWPIHRVFTTYICCDYFSWDYKIYGVFNNKYVTFKSKIRSFRDWIFDANENLSWSMNFYPLYFSWPTQISHILIFLEKIEKLKYDDFEYFFYSEYISDIDFINNSIINNFKLILSIKLLNMKKKFLLNFFNDKIF